MWGSCSIAPYRPGQPEPSCRGCGQFSPVPQAETPQTPSQTPTLAPIKLANPIKIAARPQFATPQAVQNPDQIVPESQVPRFTPRQWRNLPENEKAFWRHQKRLREAAGVRYASDSRQIQQISPESPQVSADSQPAGGAAPFVVPAKVAPPPPASNHPHQSAFMSIGGQPLDLSHFGAGGAAFLVLSGPSLKTLDLSQLTRRGAWTLGVNNAPTLFRTNAWTFVDPVEKFHDGIWKDPGILKFVHRRYLSHGLRTRLADGRIIAMRDEGRRVLAREMPGVIAINRNADFEPSRWLAEPSINWGHSKRSFLRGEREGKKYPRLLNVMICALKIIYSLGFRQVYLLGCDFAMTPDAPYAFNEKKDPGAASMNNGMYPKLTEMLRLLKPHFDAAGYRVFNCNPHSGLTVFPHVPYKEALNAATSHVPQGILDSFGWYTKGDNE